MATASPDSNTDTQAGLLPIRPAPLPLRRSVSALEQKKDIKLKTGAVFEGEFTRKELAFIEYYCQGLSEKAAAIKAGYTKNSALNASQILYRPRIWEAIQKRLRVEFQRLNVTTASVIEEVNRLANSNILDYVDIQPDGSFKVNLNNISRTHGEAIQELSFDAAGRPRIRLVDKIAARTLQTRLLGIGTDRVEITGKEGGPLTIQALDMIVHNTTINVQNNNNNIDTRDRQQLPETIDEMDLLASGSERPTLDAVDAQ